MSTKKPLLYDSFGYLLIMVRDGTWEGDKPHHVYHFGTMLEGATGTRYSENYRVSREVIAAVLEQLKTAEAEGRLIWRKNTYIRHESEQERFQATLATLRRLGADIPEYSQRLAHPDAYWNIPAMREFLQDRVDYASRI